ncbi:hypothetical protein [Frigoribacterium sp. CFBP 13707]|uniref:DUF6414 family protein n=1 Tax=Frigoribacterium sp. CFBP 13707 TaxID=2775313 RepID=UPI00178604B0|nr:hypothetical protein [Frigoribacterium sp. CFBP 13707]MBD8729394.1 hypothetical protein [Frigoribacterium sp. CFBP 13707]
MLRHFSYLNENMLGQFISALEGGLGTESSSRETSNGARSGDVDLKVVKGSASSGRERENSRAFIDTPASRFDRLLQALNSDGEDPDWVRIAQPDVEFPSLGVGTLLSWECELFTPEVVQIMGEGSGVKDLFRMMEALRPGAQAAGLDTSRLPAAEEMNSMSTLMNAIDVPRIILGDRDETDWKVFARLDTASVLGDMEGPSVVVGKVRRLIPAGSYYPLMSLPGMDLGSREERRRRAREVPPADQKNNFIEGPAVELDLLATHT